ncbi:MAG: phage integrase N-terminal SAM-like domain-containing protein [Dechloromonas sp.]|nr:MAG: phage integrase N-terminal SAM-like domain-containing protein [Dechloromonas sp.]
MFNRKLRHEYKSACNPAWAGSRGIRYKRYSIRTERVYVDWIWRFVRFHGRLHPREMGAQKVRAFLEELPGHVSVETTLVCTHVMNRGARGVVGPADWLV